MKCPNCERSIPADARFCIYCAARITPSTLAVQNAPATGPTTRLDPSVAPSYTLPVAAAPSPYVAPSRRSAPRRRHMDSIAAVWLIGMGLLILTGAIFPGVLVLVGMTCYMKETARGRRGKALESLVFFLGLTALFAFGFVWPGLLIWLGVMALIKHSF